jgi:hypothetical protein
MHAVDTRPMCHRVVVNENGLALPPDVAMLQYAVGAKVIFQRNDGWTLGAPPQFERIAWELWRDQWLCFARWPLYEALPMEFYKAPGQEGGSMVEQRTTSAKHVIHLLVGVASACGSPKGHPVEWPTKPVSHTWVRLDRAWRITCPECRRLAEARLAGGKDL